MIYDGDGNRVKATIGGVTTVYIGNYAVPGDPSGDPNPGYFAYPRDFKWNETSGTLTKYYYAGGDRVAMTTGSNTRYLLRDHPTLSLWTCLGSTTVSVAGVGSDPSPTLGTGLSELRYTAWGETRYADGTTPTKRHYTGQIDESALGLYWYGSRWYDNALGRFAQPDSIIPDMSNPLDWDRFSYARNNPLKYNDPTGHWPDWLDYLAGGAYQYANDMTLGTVDKIAASFSVCMDCNVSEAFMQGQQAGRFTSTVVSSAEMVLGAAGTGAALAAIPATAGGGLVCAGVTAGLCALPAGAAVAVEGGIAVAGVAVAGYGAATAAYIKGNSIQGHHPWPVYLLGPRKQQLYGLSRELHAQYHIQLDRELSRQLGKDYYQQMINSPNRLSEILEFLRGFNRYFDETYGTHTYVALEDVLRSEGLLPKP